MQPFCDTYVSTPVKVRHTCWPALTYSPRLKPGGFWDISEPCLLKWQVLRVLSTMDNALPIHFILTYPLSFVHLQWLTQIRWTCLTACPLGYIPIAKARGFTAQFGNSCSRTHFQSGALSRTEQKSVMPAGTRYITLLYSATINTYKSIQNYTYLHCDVPRKTSSCFIAPDFAAPKDRLLSFGITLYRLKFPSSDRYIFRVPFVWKLLNFFTIYISTIGKLQRLVLAIIRPFLPTLFSMC